MSLVYQWLDVIWLPLALISVHKGHRLIAAGYVGAVIIMLRLQTELLASLGLDQGDTGLIETHIFWRGMGVYAVFTTIYLILSHYSPGSSRMIFLAASISIFFTALLFSTLTMLL